MISCRTISIKNLYIYSVIAYLAICLWIAITWFCEGQIAITVCPSKLIFHIPCPGCGVTRATMLVLHGQIKEALCLNPNVIFSIGFLFVYPWIVLYDGFTGSKYLLNIYCSIDALLKRPIIFGLFGLAEIGIWIHNIVCHI